MPVPVLAAPLALALVVVRGAGAGGGGAAAAAAELAAELAAAPAAAAAAAAAAAVAAAFAALTCPWRASICSWKSDGASTILFDQRTPLVVLFFYEENQPKRDRSFVFLAANLAWLFSFDGRFLSTIAARDALNESPETRSLVSPKTSSQGWQLYKGELSLVSLSIVGFRGEGV